ncbi:lysosomal aspartic protease-like [Rhynchophorus ferrugineus]|uniref:lysosomal aspartic protease-like n=1 Tax=Rhynchophorus ferrugineus TaxID=354439 RepID=UPI003FCDB3D1
MYLLHKTVTIVLLFLFVKYLKCNAEFESSSFNIKIAKHKSPFEVLINSVKELKTYGIDFTNILTENRTNDSVALYRYLDNEYYAQIRVGKPSQPMNVAFDTAWTATWLMSEQCPWTTIGCIGHDKYDHSKSSLYKKDGRQFKIEDEGYNLTGFFSYDVLYVSHINVTDQMFVEMTSVPYTYIFSKLDGVIGLGLQIDAYVPFFYNLIQQKKIENPLFSIYLNRDKQSDHGGNIILGFIEKRHIHSHKDSNNQTIYDDILYLPIKSGTYWQFDLDKVFLNGSKDANITLCSSGCTALTDTSSNSIYGPKDQVDQIHNNINAKPWLLGRYSVACDTISKLPEIIFYIGGKPFSLKGRDYTIQMTWHSLSICLSAFIGDNSLNNMWGLGGAFLSEYYSIYDLGNKQIGFVKAA